ncbi:hypothetical protein BB559_002811, partial [Furculomyces boomerangus]
MTDSAFIENKLTEKLGATLVDVVDVSGGCGQMFEIVVVSPSFVGIPLIKRMVNEAISNEISQIHGFTL